MKKIFLILSASLLLTSCSIKQYEGTTRTVSVSGTGSVYVSADKVNITFSVKSTSKDPIQATTQNAEKMNSVIEAVTGLGIAKNDITTKNFSLTRLQNYKNGNYYEGDYVCTNTINVLTKEKEKAGVIVDTAIKAGANSLSSLNYSCSEPEMAIKQARTLAVKNCYDNANLIVGTSGNQLGKLLTISEVSYDSGSTSLMQNSLKETMPDSTPLSSGKLEYSITMNATYEIK